MGAQREALLAYVRCEQEVEGFGDLMLTRPDPRVHAIDPMICERPFYFTGYDAFGVHWTQAEPASHRTPGQEPVLKDIADWEQLEVPDVDSFPWEQLQAAEENDPDREDKLVAVTLMTGPFERSSVLMEFEDCLVAALTEPENYANLIGKLCDYKIWQVRRICRAAHPDVVNLHDDWGTARSTFFSPDLWREVIRPHTQRLYDAIHQEGAMVCQHACGQITALVPDLIEMGIDMWEAQLACVDLKRVQDLCRGKVRILSQDLAALERGEIPQPPTIRKPDLTRLPMWGYPYETPPGGVRTIPKI